MTPQVSKLRDYEMKLLEDAVQDDISCGGFRIRTYRWGEGSKSILMVHGWEGQAGNFADIVPRLIDDGFCVYAFDGPAHGSSSKGEASIFAFMDTLTFMIHKIEPTYLLSHSFGGVATTYVLSRHPEFLIEKYVLMTTPDRFTERIQSISNQVGMSSKAISILIDRIEKKYNIYVPDMNVSDFVKRVNVKQALILHDENDSVIPLSQSQNVADKWDACRLQIVHGTGHFRILRDEVVLEKICTFLT